MKSIKEKVFTFVWINIPWTCMKFTLKIKWSSRKEEHEDIAWLDWAKWRKCWKLYWLSLQYNSRL